MVAIGIETEFGFAATNTDDTPDLTRIIALVGEHNAHNQAKEGGLFLASGGRLYLDSGQHLEYSTPEMPCPATLVIAVRAGEDILRRALRESASIFLARANHCHIAGTTYGSHENYSHTTSQSALNHALRGHFTSRIVYTGSGGVDPVNPGLGFVLSQRATHLRGGECSSRRSICNTRRESHATDGSSRLHNISGDSQCLNRPLYLRVGTTALLVALFEANRLSPDDLYTPVNWHDALQTFNRDLTLRATIEMSDGSHRSALDMQHQLHELVAEQVRKGAVVPHWAEHLLDLWAQTLDRLEDGDPTVAVDWVQKHRLFTDQIDRSGIHPDAIAQWNLKIARGRSRDKLPDESVSRRMASRRFLFDTDPASCIQRWSMAKDITQRLHTLRRHLCKLDFFFATLPTGLFEPIAETIDDSLPGVTDGAIAKAMTCPPEGTRAAVRSHWIKELQGLRSFGVTVQWNQITDVQRRRVLDMPNPLSCEASWYRLSHLPEVDIDTLSAHYNRGDLRNLRRALRQVLGDDHADSAQLGCVLEYVVWCESRSGCVAKAERALRRGPQLPADEASRLNVAMYRFCGLIPARPIWRWIKRCECADQDQWDRPSVVSFLENKACALRSAGRVHAAIRLLRRTVAIELPEPRHRRITARALCLLADCLRTCGEIDEARELLERGGGIFTAHGFEGEHADYYLNVLAKLTTSKTQAVELLRTAALVHRRLGNPVGHARSLMIAARWWGADRWVHQWFDLLTVVLTARAPDLRRCPVFTKITGAWDDWLGGGVVHSFGPWGREDRFWPL